MSHHTVDCAPNAAENYLEPVLAAAWAVAERGRAIPVTLGALHTALAAALPDWARGDVLTARHHLAGHLLWHPTPPPAP